MKLLHKIVSICIFIMPFSHSHFSNAQSTNENIVLHYKFEDTNTKLIHDESGNHNQGERTMSTSLVKGYKDLAIQLSSKEDYIKAPKNINSDLQSFTFSTWVKFDELKGSTRFFDWGNGSNGNNNFLAFIPSYGGDNKMMALRFRPASGSVAMVFSNRKCPVGVWTHIALSFEWNKTTNLGTAIFYINGQHAGQGENIPYNAQDFLGSTIDNFFGRSRYDSETNGFSGLLDELKLYNKALNNEEILEISELEGVEGDLIAKFDFSNSNGTAVHDIGKYKLTGTLKNEAKIITVGTEETGIYNVLNLGNNQGYFDMGSSIGDLLVQNTDYTISAYYRIDEDYSSLKQDGNFLWNFSNSSNAQKDKNGYLIGSLKDQKISITPSYFPEASGNQSISFSRTALKGNWHNLTYTQSGNVGTLYIDGVPITSSTITNTPFSALTKSGLTGTPFNWIGRSCYPEDTYLRKTLVYDFRLYRRALNVEQIRNSVLDIDKTIERLERATNRYLGEEKTAESTDWNNLEHPKAHFMLSNMKNGTANFLSLSEINEFTFDNNNMIINLKNGTIETLFINDIKNLRFTSTITNIRNSFLSGQLKVYPNPVINHLFIENISETGSMVELYTVDGMQILKKMLTPEENVLDFNQFPKGVYILKTNNKNFKLLKK